MRKLLLIAILPLFTHLVAQNNAKLDSLIQLVDTTPDIKEKVDIYVQIAELFRNSDSANTKFYANKAIEQANEIGYFAGKADALYDIGWNLMVNGYYRESIEKFEEVVRISKKTNYKNGLSDGYNGIGIIYFYRGDLSKALDYYFMSLEIREKIADPGLISQSLNNIGGIYFNLEEFEKALDYYKRSYDIKLSLHDKFGLSKTSTNLGLVCKNLNQFDKALEYYKKSLELKQELGLVYAIDDSYNNIGSLYQDLKLFDSAIYYFNKSLESNKKNGDKLGEASSYGFLGEMYNVKGYYSMALDQFQKSIELYEEAGSPLDRYYRNIDIGLVYLTLDKPGNAKTYFLKGLEIANEIGVVARIRDAAELLTKAEFALQNYEAAYRAHVLFKKMSDSLANDQLSIRLARMEADLEFQKAADSIQYANEKEKIRLDQKIRQQRTGNALLISGLIILMIVVTILFRYYQNKRRANKILSEKNKQIEEKNREIQVQKDNLQYALEELQQTKNQLIQSEKMASMGILSAGISHEINNPLNFIKGGIENFSLVLNEKGSIPDSEETRTLLKIVNEGITRITTVLRNLDIFSQQDQSERKDCNIREILETCLLVIRNQSKNTIEIISHYPDEQVIITGNINALYQAFLNILTNAEQAINQKGVIEVSVESLHNSIRIYIKDNGVGIPEKNLSKIVDPFFTTKEPTKGSGLGISIAYSIIKDHNGKISFRSKENEGTEVIIDFLYEK